MPGCHSVFLIPKSSIMSKQPAPESYIPKPKTSEILARHRTRKNRIVVDGESFIVPLYQLFSRRAWALLPHTQGDGGIDDLIPKQGFEQVQYDHEVVPDPPEAGGKKKGATEDDGDGDAAALVELESKIVSGGRVTKKDMVKFVGDKGLKIENPDSLSGKDLRAMIIDAINKA